MKIVTCASYYGTGSSAVTDYLTEFKDICSLGKYEYRFVWDPDGISDLEYNIVENNNRHNTSYAIKRYVNMVNKFDSFGYGGGYKIFGGDFKRLTNQYINEITQLKARSWWHRDRIDRGNLFCYFDRAYSFFKRLFNGGLHTQKRFSLLQKSEMGYFSAISDEQFLDSTKKYITEVFSLLNKDNMPIVMADQLVPPTNISRYLRYFDDLQVVVVERDPRDLYLIEQNLHRGVVPIDSVEEFVEWFKITRKYSKPDNDDSKRILRLHFEELIYDYDTTTRKIKSFIGLTDEQHFAPKEYFNPMVSIKNTNLKYSRTGYDREIKYIENELSEYLFDFNAYIDR